MITAFNMDWVPKEGVTWAAKYSSSGMRTFSSFRIGSENPIAHRTPPWSVADRARRLPAPLTASFVASIPAHDSRNVRVKSAPSQHLRPSDGRALGVGNRKKESLSEKQKNACSVDQESKLWRRRSADRINSGRRTHSAGHLAEKQGGDESGSPRQSSSSRARSAWGRLSKHVVTDPEPELLKPLWGFMISRLPSTRPPPPPTPSCTPRTTSSMSSPQSEVFQLDTMPTKPPPPAVISKSRAPSAREWGSPEQTSTDPDTSRHSSSTSRSLRPFPFPPERSDSSSTLVGDSPRPDKLRYVLKLIQESEQSSSEDAARPESPVEELEDLELPSTLKEEEGEEEEERNTARARSNSQAACVHARPESEILPFGECEELEERRFRFKKGGNILAAQRAARHKGSSGGNESEELDPEFLLQRLIRQTASSRSRQVTHLPASSYTHSGGAAPHKQKTPSFVRPNRFKGTRSVSANELRDIVNRLSACDPANVPDSGRSRSRGKGVGDRCHTAWSEQSPSHSGRSKTRSGLYVRGLAEKLVVRRSPCDT
ncbi:hypothetical protein ACOMHN_029241 [Nucella lapillus]